MNSQTCKSRLSLIATGAILIFIHPPSLADRHCAFHMDVQDSFTLSGGWQAFTGIVGRGELQVGDAIRITQPDGTSTVRVVGRIGSRGTDQDSVGEGDPVAVMLVNADKDGLGDAVDLDGHCGAEPPPVVATPEPGAVTRDLPTEWYGGLRITTSPDGKHFQGAVEALIERVYDQPNGIIIDTVLENDRLVPVTLRQTDNPSVFSVEREDGAYTGTVTFAPDAWNPTSWTIHLALADGSRMEGTGTDNGEALLIEQYVVGPDGERREKITHRLPRIQQTIYEAKRNALVR